MNETSIENGNFQEERQQDAVDAENEKIASDICATQEIEIEEVAIDGICGVY